MPPGILLWANMPNDFVNGKAAMIWHSSGSLTNILKQAKFNVGVSYTVGEKGFGAPTGGGNMYIMKGIPADHQAAAWKFIQFMTSADIQADWSINTGYVASRQSAYQHPGDERLHRQDSAGGRRSCRPAICRGGAGHPQQRPDPEVPRAMRCRLP